MNLESLFGSASTFLRPAISSAQMRNALWNCLERALEHASTEQGLHAEAIRATLIEENKDDAPQLSMLLSTDLGHLEWPAAWTHALYEAISNSSLDLSNADLGRFCHTAFERYREELEADAKRPDSKLTNALSISMLTARSDGYIPPAHGAPEGPFSNLWKRPRPAKILERPAVQTVESHLARHGSAHLSGGPGSGKSMVARLVADRAFDSNSELSVWWMDGSTREGLEASCVELCAELGITPGEDLLMQTKALLAHHGEWLLVVDDLGAGLNTEEVIPASTPTVKVLVTSRSPVSADPDRHVPLYKASEELMIGIARDALTGTDLGSSLTRIIAACDRNPLAVATVCRFLAATAATSEDVLDLLREQPEIVLDEVLGGQYPRTFTAVVATALERLDGAIARDMLALLALAGGRLRRSDLEMIAAPNDRVEFLSGLRDLLGMGLIDASAELISCHSLLASVVVRKVGEQLLDDLAERTLATITTEAPHADGPGLHEYVRVADALPIASSRPTVYEVGARIALATHLSLFGLGRTADRQLSRAHWVIARSPDDTFGAMLTMAEAGVLFQRGEISDAEKLARRALEQLSDGEIDPEAARDVYVQATMCLAECRSYFEEWERAAQYAQYAVKASEGDPDVKAAALKLRIPTLDAREQLAAFLDLAETPELSPTSRAESLALASRAALDLEHPGEAVGFARRALEIDTAETGPDSQFTARDLNDLGNALIAAGDLAEAAECLGEAISIYEAELPDHAYTVHPRMHLARVLTDLAFRDEPRMVALLEDALDTLSPALVVQRRIAPSTIEMSSLLVAQANATIEHAAAIVMLREALEIDQHLYGDGHPEVCIDVIQLATRHLVMKNLDDALDTLLIATPHIGDWESERPSLAVNALSLLLLVRLEREKDASGSREIRALRVHLERLMPRIPRDSMEYVFATRSIQGTRTE